MQTLNQVRIRIDDQVWAQIKNQGDNRLDLVRNAVISQVWRQIDNQIYDQIRRQLLDYGIIGIGVI